MIFQLTEEEMNQCTIFSRKCVENQQKKEFGEGDTKPRSDAETARDNMIGK